MYPVKETLVPPFARRAREEEKRACSRTRAKNVQPYLAPLASHYSYEIND